MRTAVVLLFVASCGSAAAPTRVRDAAQEEEQGGRGGGGGGNGSGGSAGSRADALSSTPPPTGDGSILGDSGPSPDGGGGSAADGSFASDAAPALDAGGLPPLAACPRPSVDHLEIWEAHGGSLRPPVGSNLLVKDGDRYQAKVDFLPGGEWHEIVVPLVNSLSKKTDLTSSKGFTLTYSATAELHVQLRPLSHPHGGDQWTAKLPSTGGAVRELFVPFTPDSWGMLLGTPSFPFSQALRDANFFNFIGPPGTANNLVVKGLRIDGFIPPCS
jgi:hypothetical protein